MAIVNGLLEYILQNEGSKSEGYWAFLKCNDGKEYTLYRSGIYPLGDEYFASYHGKVVRVVGDAEERTGYFCVGAIEEVKNELNEEQDITIEL